MRVVGDLQVRRLSSKDARSVALLLHQLGYRAEEEDVRCRIDAWTSDRRGAALGAYVGQTVVGCAAIYVIPFFERPGSRARLVALVVDARYRQRGVGLALVDHARAFAVALGAVEIEVTSRRERTGAEHFYRKLGFSDVTGRSRRYIAET